MINQRYITTLLIITFLSINANSSFAQKWELKKKNNGISVFTRQIEGSNAIEFMATVTVNAPKSVMTSILRNVDDYSEWMSSSFTKINKVTAVNSNEWYVYYEASIPWPFENRDIVMHVKTSENGGADMLKLTSTPSHVSEKDGIVRVKEAEGQWTFVATADGKTCVTYQFYGDPETSVPAWLMDKMVVEGSYTTMANLKKFAKIHHKN